MKMSSRMHLAKGQVWKTAVADFRILGRGREFICYQVAHQLGQKRVSSQISAANALANYLRFNKAELISQEETACLRG
jgi:hypothetical protein